ncbi:MAG TPA: methyltransferase [Vicinamibacterales bacterium]|jgi:hypothetical protein
MQIVQGAIAGKLLAVVTEAGVPDALAAGPRRAAEIATTCHLDPGALSRALRALEMVGVFSQQPDGRWSNTELGRTLVSDAPGSIRDYVVYALHDGNWRAWQHAQLALTSGRPSFPAANDGLDFWTCLDAHPPVATAFHRGLASMAAVSARALPPILAVDRFVCVADIGGGNGLILSALLDAAPQTRGIRYDTSAALAEAQALLSARGLLDRVELVRASRRGAPGDRTRRVDAAARRNRPRLAVIVGRSVVRRRCGAGS